MTSVGKHFFLAAHGNREERAAHLDSAFSKIPAADHDLTFLKMVRGSDHPHKATYAAAWNGIRRDETDILDRAHVHPNHMIRAMAIRTCSNSNLPWHQIKKMGQTLSKDPHPYVVGQVVKFAPGTISDDVLDHIENNHPDPEIRAKAYKLSTERAMFGTEVK